MRDSKWRELGNFQRTNHTLTVCQFFSRKAFFLAEVEIYIKTNKFARPLMTTVTAFGRCFSLALQFYWPNSMCKRVCFNRRSCKTAFFIFIGSVAVFFPAGEKKFRSFLLGHSGMSVQIYETFWSYFFLASNLHATVIYFCHYGDIFLCENNESNAFSSPFLYQ